ncbi:MAG TPA: zf-HC2 domain-containing protein [Actinomycetota bacterium]|nr:zf-HC2 domain-containing protein [Actinomycetota bacterium]
MIACADAVKQLWDYLDRTLPEIDRVRVQEHLEVCRTCCGELEFAQELQAFLAAQRDDEIPPDARARLEALLADLKES